MTFKLGSVVLFILVTSQALEVAYEKMEQISGFDVLESTLRVRKYNRTTMVLNGTLIIKKEMNNTFVIHSNFYHSPLGNQQWNHYPMKLPARGICEFLYSIYDEYYKYIEDIVNLPKKGECPIMPREAHVYDKVFPSEVIPPVIPKGLWKAILTAKVEDVERTRIELIMKVYSDKFY
ncbi:AGAP008958-PA-like protein [Anopheles sinensis]|uniref:AGAP008958-PA-like protein n=1 Tax=Anopheles sinensis TaxID=74873 RepID=A0A084WQH0_ANOSI|nr:AGAP008958-PA-like protein [Anopheles sinensis]